MELTQQAAVYSAEKNKLMFSGVGSEFMDIREKVEAGECLGVENIFLAEGQKITSEL